MEIDGNMSSKLVGAMTAVKDFLLDLFFPIECFGCGREGVWLCLECFNKVPLSTNEECPVCHYFSAGGQTCIRCKRKTALDGVVSASSYDNEIVHKLITGLKYKGLKELSFPLAQVMIQKLYYQGLFLEENWLLVPVPLHRKRFLERGFNQAELLAKKIEQATGLELALILRRRLMTPPQADLTGKDRLINTAGAFRVSDPFINKKVLLVDDVFTTGATMNECAKVLKKAGAKEVWGLTAARG